MQKYKAYITRKNFADFVSYYSQSAEQTKSELKKIAKFFFTYNNKTLESARIMLGDDFTHSGERYRINTERHYNRQFKVLIDYCDDHGLGWNVMEMHDDYLSISFSGNLYYWDKRFVLRMEEVRDYSEMTMDEVRQSISGDVTSNLLPAEMNGLSIAGTEKEKASFDLKMKDLEKEEKAIRNAETDELAEMKRKIEEMERELREKKTALMNELNAKKSEMKEKIDNLNKQVYMMESEIYAIRSYSGETVELNKVRSGKTASPDTPLVVNQKLMYLDEDLARICSVYQKEIAKEFTLFEDALAANDDVFESFCPQERCLTFFRLSFNASYSFYNCKTDMYQMEDLVHGKKIGFILRDGETAYIGWLDEAWRDDGDGDYDPVTFSENLIYQAGNTEVHQLADEHDVENFSDSQNSMLSRVFAISVVQGILDNGGLLQFPEQVSLTKPGKYICYNFADGWIMDDRFGDFATLVKNLNMRTKVDDTILICFSAPICSGRGMGNRTVDCTVSPGLNRVNYVEMDAYGDCSIYVSEKKKWSRCGATANVLIRENEYINITYMNTIWLKYYIQTKKLGRYSEDYAKMVKHFKQAYEIIGERETAEMAKIKAYYPAADTVPEWQILLSHWKLNHHIRFITDFQAKRIAKYLEDGDYKENAHLFDTEERFSVEATFDGQYTYTRFDYLPYDDDWSNRRNTKPKDERDFSQASDYYHQGFYLDVYYGKYLSGYMTAENEKELTEKLPALEKLVPDRINRDVEKLKLVHAETMKFMHDHGIRADELKEMENYPCILIAENRFLLLSDLASHPDVKDSFYTFAANHYKEYVYTSELWKVAYYDYVHQQYNCLLHDIKMRLHEHFLDDVLP